MAGLGKALGFGQVTDWLDPRRNAIMGLGAGIASGQDLGQGVALGLQGAMQGRQADDAYATAQKAEAERQRQIEEANALKGKYAEFFIQQNRPDIAQGIADGIVEPGAAYMDFIKPKGPIKGSAGDVFFDPETMQPISSVPDPKAEADAQQQLFGREKDLAAQYAQQDPVKTYQLVKGGYERVRQSKAADSGAGDVGLVYGFMKMLDPGSVVREGEFATAESTAGIPQQIVGLYNRALSGERLTPEQRQQFVALADQLYQESAANLSETNAQFGSRANPWGVDASRFAVQPETFQPMQAPPLTQLKSKYGLD